ncbi:MAG: type II secretion system protein [Akkermansiaceae bacterium]
MKHLQKHDGVALRSGFTLIEMTVAISAGMILAVMALTMFNQQLASFKILKTQDFLVREAPQINNSLGQIVSKANTFQMFTTLAHAENGSNPVVTGGKVLALKFNEIDDSSSSYGVVAYDEANNRLEYYHVESLAQLTSSSPRWSISRQVHDAQFFVENGVLRMTLTGPNGGEITYSTTTLR